MPSFLPDVVGLDRVAAAQQLTAAGLETGWILPVPHPTLAAGTVVSTDPPAGEPVNAGALIDLKVSVGRVPSPGANNLQDAFADLLPTLLFTGLGLTVFAALAVGLWNGGFSFIKFLADSANARGLITFLVAVSSVGMALMLLIAAITLQPNPENAQRFDRAKQVVALLIGILGTIIGYYYGVATASGTTPQTQQTESQAPGIVMTKLPDATVGVSYSESVSVAGLSQPVLWKVEPNLPGGLNLNLQTGTVSGTPTSPSAKTEYTFTVTERSAQQKNYSAKVTLAVRPKT